MRFGLTIGFAALIIGTALAQDATVPMSHTMVVAVANTEFSCLPREVTVMRAGDFKIVCASEVHEMQWHPPGKEPVR